MTIQRDIAEERIRIGKAVSKSKFAKGVVNRILDPLLEKVGEEMEDTADWIGAFIVGHLKERIMASEPAGGTYKIILVDTNAADSDDAYTEIGEYTASAAGQPPASFPSPVGVPTGTLHDSISYEIDDDGKIRVGVFNSTGNEYTSLFYRAGKIFVTDDEQGSRTNVEDYANILDTGGINVSPRPWFRDVMEELRPDIRRMIRERLKKALNRSTRSAGGRKIYFRVYFENKANLASSSGGGHAGWRDEI
jgi:hypothetical protein